MNATSHTVTEGAVRTSGRAIKARGLSEMVMVALLGVLSLVLIIGAQTMEVLSTSKPGPEFTPLLIGVGLAIAAVLLAIDVVKNPETDPVDQPVTTYQMSVDMLHDLAGMTDAEDSFLHAELLESRRAQEKLAAAQQQKVRVNSDWKTLLLLVGATLIFVASLPYLGWVIGAAALFWVVSYLLGSTRPIFDIWVALIVSSVVQLCFGGLMGLNLPAGIIGG